jgi:predicted negative regulator of RcsB-dependent stress response
MRDDLEQQEQLDAIKGFWNDNKRWIVPFISILVAAAVAFNLWNWYTSHRAAKASQALDALVLALAEQSLDKARVAHAALAADYGSTAQAAMGGLQMARVLASSGNLPEARAALQAVAKDSPDEFAWIAKIRLAGVMLDEDNAAGALAEMAGSPPKALLPLVLDRRGDVYMALGQKENARTAWKAALEGLAGQSPTHGLVLRKLQTIDSFGG